MSKAILKSDMVPKKVLEYVPPKFELGTSDQAKSYLEGRMSQRNDFRMSDVIRVQTGVQKVEASNVEEGVEKQVLERLKEVQETAYQEAYQLGLDEGKHEAYQKTSEEIKVRLDRFEVLLNSIGTLKKDLIANNETHLVQLAFHMAKRLAYRAVDVDPGLIIDVMRDAVEKAQVEEEVVVQVSPLQIEFLETLKNETGREFEFMKKLKLEPVEGVTPGGCVIHTNYGEIDARIEGRIEKLWEGVKENLHRVKDKVSST
ncbi:MAG: FliH/SctL family protein [Pseudobdellovibrionaceae bacterium]